MKYTRYLYPAALAIVAVLFFVVVRTESGPGPAPEVSAAQNAERSGSETTGALAGTTGAANAGSDAAPGPAMMMSSFARRLEYESPEDVRVFAEIGPAVIFFEGSGEASRTALAAVDAEFGRLPPNATFFTAAFDDADARSRYGVEEPATFVLVGSDGEPTQRWTGADFDGLLERIESELRSR